MHPVRRERLHSARGVRGGCAIQGGAIGGDTRRRRTDSGAQEVVGGPGQGWPEAIAEATPKAPLTRGGDGRMLGCRCGAGPYAWVSFLSAGGAGRSGPRISPCTSPRRDMPRRRPSQLRAEAQQLVRPTTPLRRPKVGGASLSGSARAAVLQYERKSGLIRGSLLIALDVWRTAAAVIEPPVTSCGIWECCGFHRPVAETRDIIDDLLRGAPASAARELRRHVREADIRIAGQTSGTWWRDPLRWQ